MLNRQNVYGVSREAYRLLELDKAAIGRTLRRFICRLTGDSDILVLSFAYEEGHSTTQLDALQKYAKHLDEMQQPYIVDANVQGVATRLGTLLDASFGLVSTSYQLCVSPAKATVSQLRGMVKLVAILSDSMHEFASNANGTALQDCPDYRYRKFPCCVVPDEELWAVSGQDCRGMSGVLEWCVSEEDAREVAAAMNRYPERFTGIKAERWVNLFDEEPQAADA